jgi:hypothetical protein
MLSLEPAHECNRHLLSDRRSIKGKIQGVNCKRPPGGALKDDMMVRLLRQIKITDPTAPFTHEKHPVRLMLDIINEKAYIKLTFRAGFV